jgi:hypothetical protein
LERTVPKSNQSHYHPRSQVGSYHKTRQKPAASEQRRTCCSLRTPSIHTHVTHRVCTRDADPPAAGCFFSKIKAGALLYHIRRRAMVHNMPKQHHHTTNPKTEQTPTTPHTTTHDHVGEKINTGRRLLHHCTNTVSHQRCNPLQARRPPSSSTMRPSPSNANTRSSIPPIQEASAYTLVTAQGTPTDPGYSAWGPRLIHRLTLCQELM